MLKWLKKLFNWRYPDKKPYPIKDRPIESYPPKPPQPPTLLPEIKGLKHRSENWTDKDLKEIVEVIYFLNNRILELSDNMERIKKSRLSNTNEISFRPSIQPQHSYRGDNAAEIPHSVKSYDQREPKHETSFNSRVKRSESAIEEFQKKMQRCKRYMELFEDALNHIENNKKVFEIYKRDLVKPFKDISEELSKLGPSDKTKPEKYEKFTKQITTIPITMLLKSLCSSIEDEMNKQEDGTDPSKRKILEDKIEQIAKFMNWRIINPDKGDLYSEEEHVIIEHRSGYGKRGGIYKVHKRGYKKIDSGKIIQKAQVSVIS